jgi:hypothetical protein
MQVLVIICVLLTQFNLKWYIPQGIDWGAGRLCIGDTDRDGNYEFIIRTYGGSQKIYFYELHLPDSWEVDSFSYLYSAQPWDIGDFDMDGLADLVIQASATQSYPTMVVSIAESPDSFSYPTQEVWRDTVGQAAVLPISACDIDQDGLREIVKVGANGIDFVIYESVGNDLYERIYEDTIQGINTPTSTIAFGDFDGDSNVEFVLGNLSDGVGAAYWLYESPADNTYEFIHLGSVPTKNIKDCFSVSDADGDGKLEFVVKGFTVPDARIHAFIFEATGDNTYEIIKTFDLFGGYDWYGGGYSEAGDVDGDSIPEIVLEGCQSVHIIKSAGNDSFYVWETLPGNLTGSSVRVTDDIDNNGLNEIVISGNNQTRIYEFEPGGIEERNTLIQTLHFIITPNPFTYSLKIALQTQEQERFNINIYDVSGRLVKNLYEGVINGNHILNWNGNDENGRAVAQGIYFVQIKNLDSGDTEIHKVLKVR